MNGLELHKCTKPPPHNLWKKTPQESGLTLQSV